MPCRNSHCITLTAHPHLHTMTLLNTYYQKLTGLILPLVITLLFSACNPHKTDKPLIGGRYTTTADGKQVAIDAADIAQRDAAGAQQADPMPQSEDEKTGCPAPLDDRSEQILVRTAYTTSYNRELRLPNWVQWTLTAGHVDGQHKRKGQQFHEDEQAPTPRATHYDYMRSGYDRGHMCPSGDNKWSAQAQNESFLLTNICPQNHNLNTGDWNDLEMLCRSWARRFGKIYIVCGPILKNQKHKTIGRNRVTVPEGFFKVVLRLGNDPAAIGFVFDNQGGSRPIGDYACTMKEVEQITGMRFFSELDPQVRDMVEATGEWSRW